MSNVSITYTALRGLVDGTASGDEILMEVTVTKFSPSIEMSKTETKTKSGIQDTRLFYTNDNWDIEVVESGTVTLADNSTAALNGDYMNMFLKSVAASEAFLITLIDEDDAEESVQLDGSWSIGRRAANYLNQFIYNFTIRRVIG